VKKTVIWMIITVAVSMCTAFALEQTAANRNRVIMLGVIHDGHETSEKYSLTVLRDTIRAIDPDYVVTEIPPDRLAAAAAGFATEGIVTEPRVKRFSEYREVLFPLTKEMAFSIIPAAGWTKAMADYRRAALQRISTDPARAADWKAYQEANDRRDAEIGDRADDPLFIHSTEYDDVTRNGLRPYATLFADDLGRGDWERINVAHYQLIEAALDHHAYENATILIMFGAGHKYWFLDRLKQRDDIILTDPIPYLTAAMREGVIND